MISKTAKTKSIILDLLSDGMEHTSDEMRSRLREEGIEVDKQSSTLKMAIYQLRVNGSEIYSRDRGVYQLKEEKKQAMLAEFITLITVYSALLIFSAVSASTSGFSSPGVQPAMTGPPS